MTINYKCLKENWGFKLWGSKHDLQETARFIMTMDIVV
jgi:hypothetical protein